MGTIMKQTPTSLETDTVRNIFGNLMFADLNELKTKRDVLLPERYIINENATILFWENGEKTIVKKCEEDIFNPRLAFLTAFFQRYCGMSKNKANKYLANLIVEEKESKKQKKPKHMKEENE